VDETYRQKRSAAAWARNRHFWQHFARTVGMRLNLFNADVQFGRYGEGKTLRELGLIDLIEAGYDYEAVPTARLRAMFGGPVDMAAVYPLLAELTLSYKNTLLFINQRHVELRLLRAGMTQDGLGQLEEMLGRF
jgi:hypothetical protein